MDEKTRRVVTFFPEETVDKLKAAAEARGWNLSRMIRYAVNQLLVQEKQRELEKRVSGEDRRRQTEAKEAFSL